MKVSASEIRPSAWANRHQDSYKTVEFEEFREEIHSANGNIQPIKVRPTANPVDGFKYEIVFGHRRHQACLELGLDVTVIVEEIDEKTLFVEMDRENRQRADLRPYEQGVMYTRALDQGLFASLRKLAEDIGADATNVSKAVNIARLPTAVLDAFESRLDIQYRWYADLSKALVQDPDLLLARAVEIASKRAAGEVITSVAALEVLLGRTAKAAPKKPKVIKVGSKVLSISESKDKISFEVDKLGKEKQVKIEKFIADLMSD
jgi:ParB family chromosome partitioning protein